MNWSTESCSGRLFSISSSKIRKCKITAKYFKFIYPDRGWEKIFYKGNAAVVQRYNQHNES